MRLQTLALLAGVAAVSANTVNLLLPGFNGYESKIAAKEIGEVRTDW